MSRKILFVCYANVNRSPTAEDLFKEMASESGYRVFRYNCYSFDYDFYVSSAGINSEGENQMTQELAGSFDEIYAFDSGIVECLKKEFRNLEGRVVCLDIKDNYKRDSPELVKLLRPVFERLLLE